MKTLKFKPVILLLVLIPFFGCESEKEEDPVVNTEAQIVFWSNFQGPPIEVSVSGIDRGTITAINNSAPECNSSGNVTITLSTDTYTFYAEETSDPFRTWTGNFTLNEDTPCLKFLLEI